METKQAVLPLSAPVSASILLCFGNRYNHITVFDETIFVSSMTLYQQAGHSSIQMLFCFAKMLVGLCPNPICSASCRCRRRVCSKHFYNKKDSPRVLPCGKNSRLRCKSLSFQHGHRLRGAAAPGWEKNFHRLHRGRGCTGRDHGAEVGVRLPHLQ